MDITFRIDQAAADELRTVMGFDDDSETAAWASSRAEELLREEVAVRLMRSAEEEANAMRVQAKERLDAVWTKPSPPETPNLPIIGGLLSGKR